MSQVPTVATPVVPKNSPENSQHVIVIQQPMLESIEEPIKAIIYSRSKTVKYLTMIDMLFLLINLILSIVSGNLFWLFFIFLPLCYCGYKGATEYKKNYLIGYLVYLTVMTIFYMFLTFFYNSLFILLIFFIELYILYYTFRLYGFLSNSTPEIIESLQNGWNPDNVAYYYF
tara:strand:- start:47 stop:562 length:516 start_codon:yes stop_codon:yes gene_type:complete